MRSLARTAVLCVSAFACAFAVPACSKPELSKKRRVLIVGVDGLRGDAVGAGTPRIAALAEAGSFDAEAVNAWTAERAWNGESATNWGLLLTGVRPERTDLTGNGDDEHRIRDDDAGPGDVPTMFGLLRRQRPEAGTAVFHTWPGIGQGAAAPLGSSSGTIDHVLCPEEGSSAERDVVTTDAAVRCLAAEGPYEDADPELVFVHLSQVDAAGHAHAYDSPEYDEAVATADELVGRMLDAIDGRRARTNEEWLVLLSSDHGGPDGAKGHANNGDPQVRTIPFVLRGDGLTAGVELTSPSLADVTPTALAWLGIDPAPHALDGRVLFPVSRPRGVAGDAAIRGAGDEPIVLTTTSRVAGAFHSLTWNGKEFLDSFDHGRQLQSAANFDAGGEFAPETFNPTEAGSRADGTGRRSSSRLLRLRSEGNELETVSRMAFWLAPGEESNGRAALHDEVLSEHVLTKRVRIGFEGMEQVLDYAVTFTVPSGEGHTFAQFEALTGYMPPEFSKFWRFDPTSGRLLELSDGPGEQSLPVVLATRDGAYAMGIFSPDQPSPGYEGAGYGRWRFRDERVVKWNCVFRYRDAKGIAPGDYAFRCFVPVGTLEDVRSALERLHARF